MLSSTRARAEDVRALASAIALGSGAGLLIGAAYLAGGQASHAPRPIPSAVQTAGQAVARADKLPAAAPIYSLRDRFRLASDLTRAVARPFQVQRIADAPSDLNCLAEAVYFEARGEASDGQRAVAQVVLNRVRHPAFPKTICAVVHQRSGSGCQFSFACSSHEAALDSLAWRRARSVAGAALHGAVMGAVGDATHFQTVHASPFAGLLKVAQIGAHVFYRFAGRDGSAGMFHQMPTPSTQPGRFEMARLDVAPREAAADMSKAASASVVSTASATPPPLPTTGLVTKMIDAKPPLPVATTAVLKPASSGAPVSSKTVAPTAKPIVAVALAQS